MTKMITAIAILPTTFSLITGTAETRTIMLLSETGRKGLQIL